MDLVTPGIGLIFWTTLTFVLLLVLLRVYAWKPILNAVRKRNESIREALDSADHAREEMAMLIADNEEIVASARKERDQMLSEAKGLKDQIISEAKKDAEVEAKKLIESALSTIESQKAAAISEIKREIALLSVEIAEKLLKEKLAESAKQEELIGNIMKDIKLN